jgi:Protein of unknown function (DUF3768)
METEPFLVRLRALNDATRRGLARDSMIFITCGIKALSPADQTAILDRVADFDDFTEDNDPWGEHDFGSFEYNGNTIFWKIDCYDREMKRGSPNPADAAVTQRVLTVLLAEEY